MSANPLECNRIHTTLEDHLDMKGLPKTLPASKLSGPPLTVERWQPLLSAEFPSRSLLAPSPRGGSRRAASGERRAPGRRSRRRITFVEIAAIVNRAAQQVVIGWSESSVDSNRRGPGS